MDDYIREYSKTMPDDTWRNYAWRTKLNALKKILVLYIANGGEWEDSFEEFCWWSFNYGMWVKMNLFYMQARDAFDGESLLAGISIKSPLELLNSKFSRQEFYNACKQCGYTSKPRMLLHKYKDKGKIKDTDQKDFFELVLA